MQAEEIGEVELGQVDDGQLRGLYAAPLDGDEDSPCVLLLHDVFGLQDFVRASLLRLAGEGFHALTVDLYGHAGVAPAAGPEDAQRAWAALPDRAALRALEQAAVWLGQRGDRHALGLVGFGMGGSLAFLMGCTSRRVAALVSCCGSTLYPELSQNKPAQPLELFLNLDRPYLGLFAESDASVPTGHRRLLSERLEAGHKSHELVHYPGTQADFMNAFGANYDEASAGDAWQRTLTFLQESL